MHNKILLILASTNDDSAREFSEFIRLRGIRCLVSDDFLSVIAVALATSDGTVEVRLTDPTSGTPITAIVNRGVDGSRDSDTFDEAFSRGERLAAWWSLLAFFPGPVVNRPSTAGFVPNLDVLSLRRAVPSIRLQPGTITTDYAQLARRPSAWPSTNVHRLSDGSLIGLLGESVPFDDDVFVATPFDPARTVHILVAGHSDFDLSTQSGELAPHRAGQIRPVIEEVVARGASFCLLVFLDCGDDRLALLATSAFPQPNHFRHLRERVHSALTDYLSL